MLYYLLCVILLLPSGFSESLRMNLNGDAVITGQPILNKLMEIGSDILNEINKGKLYGSDTAKSLFECISKLLQQNSEDASKSEGKKKMFTDEIPDINTALNKILQDVNSQTTSVQDAMKIIENADKKDFRILEALFKPNDSKDTQQIHDIYKILSDQQKTDNDENKTIKAALEALLNIFGIGGTVNKDKIENDLSEILKNIVDSGTKDKSKAEIGKDVLEAFKNIIKNGKGTKVRDVEKTETVLDEVIANNGMHVYGSHDNSDNKRKKPYRPVNNIAI